MADRNQEIKAHLLATFRGEAEEHLQAITAGLLALDRPASADQAQRLVEGTFREVHTLKGAARSVSLLEVESLCQALETVLSRMTRGEMPLSRPILDLFNDAADSVARLLAGSEAPGAVRELIGRLERASAGQAIETAPPLGPPRAPASPAAPGSPAADTIRLAAARLDALIVQAEDLLLPKLAVEERVREIRALVDALARLRKPLRQRPSRSSDTRPAAAELEADLRCMETQARELLGHLARDQRAITAIVDALQEELRRLRMMPAATILDPFPRMVRDLTRGQGKDAVWEAGGADLELDRRVLEAMKDPLLHLVRNAVDHGIEAPEARARAGKPPQGRVTATFASLERNRVQICVEDDGRGIDLAQVRAAAVRARLVTAGEAESLPDEAALALVFRSGLSTSPIITNVSGNGLGLAIVKERVERLDGQVFVETRPGSGTSVRMVLPATIVTFRGLLIRTGGQPFLLPTDAVERAIRVAPEAVQSVEGREAIRWNGHALSIACLSDLLGLSGAGEPLPESRPARALQRPCVIVRLGEERAGFLVEEVLGDREVLVKELGPPLFRVRNVAGAGLLGTGQVVLILRPSDLLRSVRAESRQPASRAAAGERGRLPMILVVDDSITTRTMEKNLLEAAGYQVKVAVDGVDAWTVLKSEEVGLVVLDVDMPRMDGLELTARIRADRGLADLPVVLVTALETREDKERGIEVGANAYVVKSSFDQSNLLGIIRRLL